MEDFVRCMADASGRDFKQFFRWYEQEQREGWDSLQWRSFERRIRAEMTEK